MNNIINTAISNVNAERQVASISKAQGLIGCIERENQSLELLRLQVTENQEALRKLAGSEITFEKVLGFPKSTNPSATEATIIKSVEAIVMARQKDGEVRSTNLANAIANNLDAITATEKRIAELRDQLVKISTPVVQASAIVGE
jgi:hypothetical protein